MSYKDIEKDGFLFILDEKEKDDKVWVFKHAEDGMRFLYMVEPTKDMKPSDFHQGTVEKFFSNKNALDYEGKTKEGILAKAIN